jgi:HEAT repeat protein
MEDQPPEDQPDEIWIGPIGPIPIIDEDDPRFEAHRASWSVARRKAQALHSAEELLEGITDVDWRVRHESMPRLVARWKDDPRTLDAILHAADGDNSWQVRAAAVMTLTEFEPQAVESTLRVGLEDEHEDVRWSARFMLFQLGLTDDPPPGLS